MAQIWSIRRSSSDAKLTGLCGGVARHWNVDPVLVRVGWVLLALSGGVGLVLYLAGWLLVPAEGKQTSTLDDLTGGQTARWPREAWVAVVVIASAITFAIFGSFTPFGFWPAVILAAIWYFGYYKNRSSRPVPPTGQANPPAPLAPPQPFHYPGPATPFTEAAEAWRRRMEDHLRPGGAGSTPTAGNGPTSAPYAYGAPPARTSVPAAPVWPTRPTAPAPAHLSDPAPTEPTLTLDEADHAAYLSLPDPVGLYADPAKVPAASAPSTLARSRSTSARRLRLVGILVLGLTLTGLGVADSLGATISPAAYLGASLLVVGLTLVAATWFGRARGILAVGVAVLVALVSVSVAAPAGMPRMWKQEVAYTTLAQLPAGGSQLDLGELNVDLSRLDVTRNTTFSAHVDAGRLEVSVPKDVNVVINYSVDQGVVVDNDTTVASGSDLEGVLNPATTAANEPTLVLDLSADLGEVQVNR